MLGQDQSQVVYKMILIMKIYLCMKTIILILYKKNDVVDNRGKQLLDLCIGSKLRFLNGRMWGDSYRKFTCIKPSGPSVVDYVIMSENLLKNTLYFQVSDFIPTLSDCHCKLSFGLLTSYFVDTSQNDNINRSIFPGRYIWSASIGQKLCDTLTQACKMQYKEIS